VKVIDEGRLRFSFPKDWEVAKYDEWAYFQRFKSTCGGNKGIDLVAIDGSGQLWLIEIKDYRNSRRTKEIPLWDEFALKVRDTLAGLVAAAHNAGDDERAVARKCLEARRLSVVLHLEQAAHRSKLFAAFPDPADLVLKLRTLLRPIDPHPRVVSASLPLKGSPWQVDSS